MNRKQLALVHVAKTQTGMTEDEYRDLLGSLGVKSSKELTRKGFSLIMTHFEQIGFKSTSKFRPDSATQNLPEGKRAYMEKIDAILGELDLERAYADGIAKKRFGVDKVHWLAPGELRKVMVMLTYHHQRYTQKTAKA